MPFKSKAQQRWAFATKQPFAEEWAAMTKAARRTKAARLQEPEEAARPSACVRPQGGEVSYIGTDLDCFDLWIEYGFLQLRRFLGNYEMFHRLYGE
jgi:hypothetical protein